MEKVLEASGFSVCEGLQQDWANPGPEEAISSPPWTAGCGPVSQDVDQRHC